MGYTDILRDTALKSLFQYIFFYFFYDTSKNTIVSIKQYLRLLSIAMYNNKDNLLDYFSFKLF